MDGRTDEVQTVTRKPSLEVAPTTLEQRSRQTNNQLAVVTYLQFQIQICF